MSLISPSMHVAEELCSVASSLKKNYRCMVDWIVEMQNSALN